MAVWANRVTVRGSIEADGDGGWCCTRSGFGAGGTIYLRGRSLNIGDRRVRAITRNPDSDVPPGRGGEGRIRLDHFVVDGRTNPLHVAPDPLADWVELSSGQAVPLAFPGDDLRLRVAFDHQVPEPLTLNGAVLSYSEQGLTTARSGYHRAALGDDHRHHEIPELLQQAGGLRPGASEQVARAAGAAAADVYGVASFFHLLAEPDVHVRVCQGLTCRMFGARQLLERLKAEGHAAAASPCLAACDVPPAGLVERVVVPRFDGDPDEAGAAWVGEVGAYEGELAMDLRGEPAQMGMMFRRAVQLGRAAVIAEISESGLQGRGGAGFPAGFKWKGVAGQAEELRYVVLNADEGEPGTFKDRELLIRRPELVVEGLAIAAHAVGATDVWCYLRGEFDQPWASLTAAIAQAAELDAYPGVAFHMHAGQGAYICGEETALLEALEGKRGMPRLKPPYPTEKGLWGKPTLVHNVETIACVPAIIERGGAWFQGLGRTGPGTKLYCVSGDVVRPGTYETPLGVSLDELVALAGGYVGELKAFSPGGASSGFLPAAERGRALDFKALSEVGAMLGSAGVVVLNDTRDLPEAVLTQLEFFEAESCGQCAPCRIGTQLLRRNCEADTGWELVHDVAWEMNEGSICGLGQAAPLPLTSLMRWFPEEVSRS